MSWFLTGLQLPNLTDGVISRRFSTRSANSGSKYSGILSLTNGEMEYWQLRPNHAIINGVKLKFIFYEWQDRTKANTTVKITIPEDSICGWYLNYWHLTILAIKEFVAVGILGLYWQTRSSSFDKLWKAGWHFRQNFFNQSSNKSLTFHRVSHHYYIIVTCKTWTLSILFKKKY